MRNLSNITDMVMTHLSYTYKIKCVKCDVWQFFNGSLPVADMEVRDRLDRWQCRLCGNYNETTYTLGVSGIRKWGEKIDND